MNSLQRLAARMRAIWAAARGYETGVVTPLPPPLIPPRTPTRELIEEADRQGVADASARMQDNWSFGGPDDPVSDVFDPPYVHVLRRRCAAVLATIGEYRGLTNSRLGHVGRWRDESEQMMESARTMMSSLAVREARLEAETTRRSRSQAGIDEETLPDPVNANASPDELPWEGESVVLGWFWRAFILIGLVAAEFSVQYYVFDVYFAGSSPGVSPGAIALPTAAIMVGGPYVAALLLRGRQSTGAARWVGRAVLALCVPWLYVTTVLGVLRGQLLASGGPGAPAQPLHLTPVTVVVMFVALLLITGIMAFMLGLARRHPFQDAYVRHRTTRNRLDVLRRTMADRINPAFLEPDEPADSGQEERAVVESYTAAEYAYFAALVRTVGDPTFTEAVQGRRGVRPQLPTPSPDPGGPIPMRESSSQAAGMPGTDEGEAA